MLHISRAEWNYTSCRDKYIDIASLLESLSNKGVASQQCDTLAFMIYDTFLHSDEDDRVSFTSSEIISATRDVLKNITDTRYRPALDNFIAHVASMQTRAN